MGNLSVRMHEHQKIVGKLDVHTSIESPNVRNGGKVNVQVNIKTMEVEYGAKFNDYLSKKKSSFAVK